MLIKRISTDLDVCDAGAATQCGVAGPTPPLQDVPAFLSSLERRNVYSAKASLA